MLSIEPGQHWERRSYSGAPWRPVQVVNVEGDEIELRFLDMPNAPDLQRMYSTKLEQMLSRHRQGAEYRLTPDLPHPHSAAAHDHKRRRSDLERGARAQSALPADQFRQHRDIRRDSSRLVRGE
jgi:hypothetical protein